MLIGIYELTIICNKNSNKIRISDTVSDASVLCTVLLYAKQSGFGRLQKIQVSEATSLVLL